MIIRDIEKKHEITNVTMYKILRKNNVILRKSNFKTKKIGE